jgi:parallel beta-helix repeat protein
MRLLTALVLCFAIQVALDSSGRPAAAAAAVYYVAPGGQDSQPGTVDAPWGTLQQAADTMVAGDTTLIDDGEYDGGIVQEHPGTADAPITFRAAHPGKAIVRGDRTQKADAFLISEADYVVLEGLTVRQANRAGIRVSLSNHVTIRGCQVLNNTRWGIFTGYSDDLLLEGNECAFSVQNHGIYLSNSGDRPILRLNSVHDNRASGIEINPDPESLNPDLGTRGDGITTGAWVDRNVIYNNGAGGAAGINMSSVRSSRITNNLLYNNLAGGIAGFDNGDGIEWGCKDNLILNNTLYFRPGEGRWCVSLKNGSTGNLVQNNILSGGARGALEFDDDSPLKSDYNVLFRDSNSRVATNEDTEEQWALADWQTSTGNDQHSVTGAPGFVQATAAPFDFHLLADSPAVNAGADRTDVMLDLDGLMRPQNGRWDIGCYETGF